MTLLLMMNLGFAWGSVAVSSGPIPAINPVQKIIPLTPGRAL